MGRVAWDGGGEDAHQKLLDSHSEDSPPPPAEDIETHGPFIPLK